jgi:hypothetical protein
MTKDQAEAVKRILDAAGATLDTARWGEFWGALEKVERRRDTVAVAQTLARANGRRVRQLTDAHRHLEKLRTLLTPDIRDRLLFTLQVDGEASVDLFYAGLKPLSAAAKRAAHELSRTPQKSLGSPRDREIQELGEVATQLLGIKRTAPASDKSAGPSGPFVRLVQAIYTEAWGKTAPTGRAIESALYRKPKASTLKGKSGKPSRARKTATS